MCKSETPKGPRATQVSGGTGAPTAPAGLLGAPAAQRPFLSRRIPRVPSPAAGLGLRSREAFRTRAIREPPLSLSAPLPPPPSCPALSRPAHRRGREMGREARRKPLPAAPAKKHNTAQCRRARLAPVNSGGLCSRQLFPGHLTCQLLGKCCC